MWNDLLDHEHCFLYPLKKCKKQNANNELKLINSLLGKSFLSLFIFSHSFLYYCHAIYPRWKGGRSDKENDAGPNNVA